MCTEVILTFGVLSSTNNIELKSVLCKEKLIFNLNLFGKQMSSCARKWNACVLVSSASLAVLSTSVCLFVWKSHTQTERCAHIVEDRPWNGLGNCFQSHAIDGVRAGGHSYSWSCDLLLAVCSHRSCYPQCCVRNLEHSSSLFICTKNWFCISMWKGFAFMLMGF